MKKINDVIAELIKRYGGKDIVIAAKLGVSSQRLGQYKNGQKKPGIDFIQKWKEVYGDDLLALCETSSETNVSHETKPTVKMIEMDVWEELTGAHHDLRENNRLFELEIERLWGLVNRLTTQPTNSNNG